LTEQEAIEELPPTVRGVIPVQVSLVPTSPWFGNKPTGVSASNLEEGSCHLSKSVAFGDLKQLSR
jgi:hypothetical protein